MIKKDLTKSEKIAKHKYDEVLEQGHLTEKQKRRSRAIWKKRMKRLERQRYKKALHEII